MTLVDRQGRVFGRWSALDVVIAFLLLGLIPLLYGAFLLFRPAVPSLTSVEPSQVTFGEIVNVTVRGNHLRPYMRVSFNDQQGKSFLFADSTKAVVEVSNLPPGIYDVILYDYAQERARIAKGFAVIALPRPQAELDVIGTFTAVNDQVASQLKSDVELTGLGRILRVGTREPSVTRTRVGEDELVNVASGAGFNVPAVIRANCTLIVRGGLASCVALETTLVRDVILTVAVANIRTFFQIDQVRAAATGPTLNVRVRFAGDRAVVALLKVGDVDVPRSNPFATGAAITRVGGVVRSSASVVVSTMMRPQGDVSFVSAGDIATVDAVLRLSADRTPDGWSYHGQPVKPGRVLVFHAPGYEVTGTIQSAEESPR